MKFAFLLAAVLVLASAQEVSINRLEVSGSYCPTEPPLGDFASEIATIVPAAGSFKVVSHHVLKESLIGQTITGHALVISGAASAFHIYTPSDKCPGTADTSVTSSKHSCKIATNAGFFNMQTGACVGHIISDGKSVHSSVSGRSILFGLTSAGKLVAGYGNESYIKNAGFKQLVQGRGWLVRNGASYVTESAQKENIATSFIQLLAPRLAIGWNKDGELLLVSVNGIEAQKKGLDLKTFASLLIKLGATEAVNLDGGGSVTLVWDGHICQSSGKAQEACSGNPELDVTDAFDKPYERPVTSITCFK